MEGGILWVTANSLETNQEKKNLRINTVKIMLDGVIETHTAYSNIS